MVKQMKFLMLLLLISCKPILIDRHDYIVVIGHNVYTCDYKTSNKEYRRCKINKESIEEVYFTEGFVLTIKE